MEHLRNRALNQVEQFRVERQLKDGAAPGFLRELGVEDLIRPRSERAGSLDPTQNVRSPEPSAVSKRRLQDDACARAHRIQGAVHRVVAEVLGEIDHGEPFGMKRVRVTAFVGKPAFPEEFQDWIDPVRRFALAVRDG